MSVDKDTVERIAKMARIRLKEEQKEPLAKELSNILGWVEQLSQLDTEGVPPMTSVAEMRLPLRKDEVSDGGYPDKVTANAPESSHGFYVVPKVVE